MSKKVLKKITKILTALLCIVLVVGCVNALKGKLSKKDAEPADATVSTEQPVTTKQGSTTATLMCAGDNLIHKAIFTQAKNRGGSSYDFSYAYEGVADIIKKADVAFLNQETVIVPSKEASSYPLFIAIPKSSVLP